jgi:hypothetical protein
LRFSFARQLTCELKKYNLSVPIIYDIFREPSNKATGNAIQTTIRSPIITPRPSLGGTLAQVDIAKAKNGTEKTADILKAGERYFFPQISFAFKFLLTTSTTTTAFLCNHYITQSKIFQYISQLQVAPSSSKDWGKGAMVNWICF